MNLDAGYSALRSWNRLERLVPGLAVGGAGSFPDQPPRSGDQRLRLVRILPRAVEGQLSLPLSLAEGRASLLITPAGEAGPRCSPKPVGLSGMGDQTR